MRKVLLLMFSFIAFASCNNVNKEELKKEIISELKSANIQPSVKKGDGSNFYAEPLFLGGSNVNDYCLQHSTINCPAIRNGVQRNVYKLNGYNNTFCSLCMSDELITMWNVHFFPNGYKNN